MSNILDSPVLPKSVDFYRFKGTPADFFDTAACGVAGHVCSKCHSCGTKLRIVLDGEEWCATCHTYRRYQSHGWCAEAAA